MNLLTMHDVPDPNDLYYEGHWEHLDGEEVIALSYSRDPDGVAQALNELRLDACNLV